MQDWGGKHTHILQSHQQATIPNKDKEVLNGDQTTVITLDLQDLK